MLDIMKCYKTQKITINSIGTKPLNDLNVTLIGEYAYGFYINTDSMSGNLSEKNGKNDSISFDISTNYSLPVGKHNCSIIVSASEMGNITIPVTVEVTDSEEELTYTIESSITDKDFGSRKEGYNESITIVVNPKDTNANSNTNDNNDTTTTNNNNINTDEINNNTNANTNASTNTSANTSTNAPKTGDNSSSIVWLFVMIVSMIAVVMVKIGKRKIEKA